MNEAALELLEELGENKHKYEELYNTNGLFKCYVDVLKMRLDYMINDSKQYPFDEVEHSYGRYLAYLRNFYSSTCEEFWRIVYNIKTVVLEISEDFKYFNIKIGNNIYEYNIKNKTLRK